MHNLIYTFSIHIVLKSVENEYVLQLAFLQALNYATKYIICLEGQNSVHVTILILTLQKEKACEAKALVSFPLSAYQHMEGSSPQQSSTNQ